MEIILDFETVNPYCDLTVVGSTVYSEHWATEILLLRWRAIGEAMRLWTRTLRLFEDQLALWAADPSVLFGAHNAGFEKDIWRNIMVPQFGFPDIPNDRWFCTQAACAYKAVPQGLDKALKAVCGREKDAEGSKLTISLSRFGKQGRLWCEGKGHPKDKRGKDLALPERTPELMERIYAYCASDVGEETILHERLSHLPELERIVWLLDQRINERGVALDRPFLRGAQRIVEAARAPLETEFRLITGGVGANQVAKIVEWIGTQGVQLDNLQKTTIAALLGEKDQDDEDVGTPAEQPSIPSVDALPANVRRALTIRALVGSASIRKLSRMEGCIANDGRAHRLLQYHGTGPGRWAGRLFNPLNFPRGTAFTEDTHKPCDPDTLAGAIISGRADAIQDLNLVVEDPPYSAAWRPADPIEVISSSLRHAIVAAEGHKLVVGDFVQIQARIVLALAGQTDFLAKLAAGMDPYLLTAEQIYNDPPGSLTKADIAKRQTGKNTFLGCGFQMGWAKYHEKYCPDQPEQFAQDAINAYRQKVAPRVPKLWQALQDAAFYAVYDETPKEAYGIRYQLEDGWLTARLLDGKKIYYWNPQRATKTLPWSDEPSDCWTYQTVASGGRLKTVYAYGGLLTENVVMGLEVRLLVRAMMRCEKENLPVILNIYDEIVCEAEEAHASWPVLKQIMEDTPPWAKALQLSIAAEGWVGSRYKKG